MRWLILVILLSTCVFAADDNLVLLADLEDAPEVSSNFSVSEQEEVEEPSYVFDLGLVVFVLILVFAWIIHRHNKRREE